MIKYIVSTPDADEYREAIIISDNYGNIVSVSGVYTSRIKTIDLLMDLTSVWKLFSTKYNDSVYTTEIQENI